VKPVSNPGIITLTESILNPGRSDRIAKSGQQFPGVIDNVTIMKGNDLAFIAGQDVAVS